MRQLPEVWVIDKARHFRRLGADAGELAGDGVVVGDVQVALIGDHRADTLTQRQLLCPAMLADAACRVNCAYGGWDAVFGAMRNPRRTA